MFLLKKFLFLNKFSEFAKTVSIINMSILWIFVPLQLNEIKRQKIFFKL